MRLWCQTTVALVVTLAAALAGLGELSKAHADGGAATADDAAAGEELFLDRCATCHIPDGGGQGPSLTGLNGRKAGTHPGFAYSAAVRDSGLIWTGPALDRFLANPTKALPGTAMPIMVPDAKERADLIAYFTSKRAP
jgi:cytochrome c